MSSWPTHPDIPPWWGEGRASLERPAKLVHQFDGAFRRRALRLRETMKATPNAVGLAANQVGWRAAVFVAELFEGEEPLICVNPRLEEITRQMLLGNEGCLSVPGFHGAVARPERLVLVCQDERGVQHRYALSGFTARIAMHEFDHLRGRIYLAALHRPLVSRDIDYVEFAIDPQTLVIPDEAFRDLKVSPESAELPPTQAA